MEKPQMAIRVEGDSLILTESVPGRDVHENRYSLDDLNVYGLDQARTMLGRTVLALLESWYPDEFSKRPHLKLEKDYEHEMSLVGSLVTKSLSIKTKRYVPAIESLIDEIVTAAPSLANNSRIAQWKITKGEIESYPD